MLFIAVKYLLVDEGFEITVYPCLKVLFLQQHPFFLGVKRTMPCSQIIIHRDCVSSTLKRFTQDTILELELITYRCVKTKYEKIFARSSRSFRKGNVLILYVLSSLLPPLTVPTQNVFSTQRAWVFV